MFSAPPVLSIILPTLNEAADLPRTIAHAREAAGDTAVEIIVSDCGSVDGTAAVAAALGAVVVTGACGRAAAMNAGARAASATRAGDALLFLHADTRPPAGYAAAVLRACAAPGVVGGAFDFSWGSHPKRRGLNRRLLEFVCFVNRVRYRRSRLFFGDQGLFCRRDAFDAVGGFPAMPLMEDLHFSKRLATLGRTAVLSPPARTSPRRFCERGVLRQLFGDWYLLGAESFGVRPASAWARYNAVNAVNADGAGRPTRPARG